MSVGRFGISEGNITRRKKKKKNHTEYALTATREVSQMLMSTTSELGLGRDLWAASSVLRVRTRSECPEDNLRELTRDNNPNLEIV